MLLKKFKGRCSFLAKKNAGVFSGVFLLLLMSLIGCKSSPPGKMNSITVGMPRRDVVLFLGTPKKQHQEGFREVLEFPLHKDINDPYAPDESYWVFLEDGKVVKHGREKDFQPSAGQKPAEETLNAQIRV